MPDDLTLVLRTYARALLSQGIGLVGLVWCLSQGQPAIAFVLTALVLADQGVFLRARPAPANRSFPFRSPLDLWCVVVSGADLLILCATLFRSTGLRDGTANAALSDPITCLAYAIATFAHLDIGVTAATGGGRVLAAVEGLLGGVVLLGALTLVIRGTRSEA